MAAALILLSTKFTSSFSVVSQWKATVGSPLERDRRLLFPQAATTTSTSSTTTRELGRLFSSFAADGSEYAAGDSDFDPEEDDEEATPTGYRDGLDDPEDETPTTELQPVPMSKNSGNRFVAIVWDRLFQTDDSTKDVLDLHHERISLTEEHVMFCRKQNLYNETFNAESMVDILWSLPMYV